MSPGLPSDPGPVMPTAFGTLLYQWRRDRRSTQEDLAAVTGLSVRAISNIERGAVRSPRSETARLLADGLQLSGQDRADFLACARSDYWDGRGTPAAPPAPGPVVPAELPAEPTGFSGRAGEAARLDGWLPAGDGSAPAPVVLCGPAGVGKSALAVHWARRVRHRFDGGQLWVELRAAEAPAAALGRLLRSLGVPAEHLPADPDEAVNLYRTLAADRRLLVVLDDARDADQVRPLLPTGPGSLAVVTSRDALHGLVARDGARRLRLGPLAPEEAVDLLADRLGPERVWAGPVVAELATLCGHLPLALRIAAANLIDRPAADLPAYCAELRADRLAALDPGGDEADGVRATFSLSYRALPEEARRLFRRLGLLPGHEFTVADAAALLDCDPGPAARLLTRLAAGHLVEPRGPGRWAQHDLLRVYAGELSADEDPAVRDRLLRHRLAGLRAAAGTAFPEEPLLPDGPSGGHPGGRTAALGWLDAERGTLVATALAAASHGPAEVAVGIADGLRPYFRLRPHLAEWAAVARAAVDAADRCAGPAGPAGALLSAAGLHLARDRYGEAADYADRAGDRAAAADWPAGSAVAAATAGNAHRLAGRLDAARCRLDRARELYRDARLPDGEAAVLDKLGLLAHETGELDRAARCFARALELHRAADCGDRHLADTLLAFGDVQRPLGRLDDALRRLTRSLELHRRIDDRAGEAYVLRCLAEVHRDRGEPDRALAAGRQAVELAASLGDRRTEGQAVHTLATVALAQGRPLDALTGHRTALDLATAVGNGYGIAEALLGLARAEHALDHPAAARAHAADARARAAGTGYRLLQSEADALLAELTLTPTS